MKNLKELLKVFSNGGIAIIPTDTIIGLSGDALNPEVYEKINQIKNREDNKQYVILVSDQEMAENLIGKMNEIEREVINNFQGDRPVTFVVKNRNKEENVLSSFQTIAFRIPKKGPIVKILKAFGSPLVSTSVNLSGSSSAIKMNEVPQKILDKVDFILNLPANSFGNKSSKIIEILEDGELRILRV